MRRCPIGFRRNSLGGTPSTDESLAVNPLAILTPLFLAFEVWQLVMGERYLGIRRIKDQADPRELPMGNGMAAFWFIGMVLYGIWMFTLLLHPVGRAQGAILLVVTGIGYSIRAATSLKWTLVTLTFESSIRIGMLLSLVGMSWHAISSH